ncbi:HAD-IA family hydrolase [Clavibacter michiganensis]
MTYISGKRKPDPDFYSEVLSSLKVDPTNCIFIDDRLYSCIFTKSVFL